MHRISRFLVTSLAALPLTLFPALLPAKSNALFSGVKDIPVGADGNIPEGSITVAFAERSVLKGAKQVVVPLVSVAFESTVKASLTKVSGGTDSSTTRSRNLMTQLVIDPKVLQSITDQLQGIVEADLKAQGFEVLPRESVDKEARIVGIKKDDKTDVEVGDNFMSGFAGNGTYNRWYTAGQRPLFGTGPQAALGETSAIIRTAREVNQTLLFYRFKVQYAEMDVKNSLFQFHIKGQNSLHVFSADLSVFTPANTRGARLYLKDNIIGGSGFVKEVQGAEDSGNYKVIADESAYTADSLKLLKAVSQQLALALRKNQ